MAEGKSVDDAVLAVVRESFKESTPVRFEGNSYSQDWVTEAEQRGLLNLRRTPESLAQLTTAQSRELPGVLGEAEGMHDDVVAQGKLLTTQGADRIADVRSASDTLELAIGDDQWPLPKYREMLFPVCPPPRGGAGRGAGPATRDRPHGRFG